MKDNFKILEDNYETILSEYRDVESYMKPWYEDGLGNTGWDTFQLFSWCLSNATEEAKKLTPLTVKLIEDNVPTKGLVGFSKLKPGACIRPHKGFKGRFLRYHLGIDIPEGDCGLSVEEEVFKWENGKSFIFDDTKTHSAWNNTELDRTILVIDFVP